MVTAAYVRQVQYFKSTVCELCWGGGRVDMLKVGGGGAELTC